MEMDMEHMLLCFSARAVDDLHRLDPQPGFEYRYQFFYDRHYFQHFMLRNIEYVRVMGLGYDQGVVFADGMNIQESINVVIFVHFPGFLITSHDLAEYAVTHPIIPPMGLLVDTENLGFWAM
jgi:hypothetical protein